MNIKKDKTNRNNNDKQVVEKQPKEEMSKFEKIFNHNNLLTYLLESQKSI